MVAQSFNLHAGTLEKVKKRGTLICGVSTGIFGFSSVDSKGNWQGLDVDFCRAISLAVLGSKEKVKFVSLSAQQRFTALQSGEVDVLSRNTTRILSRDTDLGINFGPTIFYDGQSIMVKKKIKVSKVKDLNSATICVQTGTTSELNLTDYFLENKLKFRPLVVENNEEVFKAFLAGRCDAITSDSSQLAAMRLGAPKPEELMILEERISKEPLSPAVRHGDDAWLDIVSWVFYVLIEAEELGINSKNVDSFKTSARPRVQRLLGISKGHGSYLKLDDKWAYKVIKGVGNYQEFFDRNLGEKTKMKLERGVNRLWTDGGLMYAMPFR